MASKSALVQKVGFLWVKQHTVVKTWQLRYVLLKKCTGYEADGCLEWYESQEAYSNCQSPKELKFNEINYAGNWVSQSKDFAFIIIVSDQKNLQLAARTETERTEWIEVFNKFLHKPCNLCVLCSSTSCSHITRTFVKRGSIVQADSYIRRRDFLVKFRNSTLGNKLDSDKDYVINVGREYVTVSISDQVESARASSLGWLLTQIRTYNSQPVEVGSSVRLLTIETGRQSSTGEGFFYFLTEHGDEIVDQIRLNTSRSYLQKKPSMDNFCVDTCGTSPEPRLLTSIPRPPGCHLFPRPSVVRPSPPGAIPFHAYDGDPTAGSEPFAHYIRGKNNYIDVLTPQEEVEKFKKRKGSRPSFDREPTSPERQPMSPDDEPPFPVYDPFASNQSNHQSREEEFSEYDAEHPTYLEVLGDDELARDDSEVAKDNGKYVNMVQLGSRDGEFEKKESLTQFPMDGHEGSASVARDTPLTPRDGPSSARASFASARASHTSTGWNSQTSQTSSVAFSSVSSENDVFRENRDSLPGDVFPHEPTKSRQRPMRISEDEEPNVLVSLSELEIGEPVARTPSLEGERDAILNGDENDTVQDSENFRRKEANSKTNSWEAVSGTDSDHAETSSSSEVGTSARNSRELSDEAVSGGEADIAAGSPARQRTSSDTSKRREASGDSDGDGGCGGNESMRDRSVTMNDAMLLKGYSRQMLQDLLKRVENPQDFPSSDFAPPNNHPLLTRESSAFINEKEVIAQLQNPTRTVEHRGSFPGVQARPSTGEIKYVCGECGWHKMRSKGSRKRSAVRKDKKCERCKRIIKAPKSPKKERSPSILNRFKEVLHRSPSTSLDSLAPDRPPLDTPNTLAAPPLLFVKQLHSGMPTFNPALDSKLGVLGIAPSPAHTAHAQSIGGEVRSSPRLVPTAGNENLSPKSRRGSKGTLALSRSEGTLGKGSCAGNNSPATVQRSPKTMTPTTNETDKPALVRTISSPVFTGSAEGPFEAATKEMGGGNEEKPAKKLSGSNLPSLPEVEDPSGEIEEWDPVSSSVESPPAIPPRTRDEPPPVPPRRSSGVSIPKDELNRLKRSETAPTNSLTTMSEGSPKLPNKRRISRTMTDPGCCVQGNSIRNALSLGDLLEDESKTVEILMTGLSCSLGEHLDRPPPLPPRKQSGPPQPPPLSPRRTLNGSDRSNNSCEVQTTESSVSYESEHQTSQSCPPERASEKAPLTSKRSLEARRHYQSRNAMYREHVTESEAVNAT